MEMLQLADEQLRLFDVSPYEFGHINGGLPAKRTTSGSGGESLPLQHRSKLEYRISPKGFDHAS
ncbi:MAG: hypothetical protein GXY83_31415 [Rhodopirellula sp.]|nr:hypothetical protein [Rhodopirellula sp.]